MSLLSIFQLGEQFWWSVHACRRAAKWFQTKRHLFVGSIRDPLAATTSDEKLREIFAEHDHEKEDKGSVCDLMELTLFLFEDQNELIKFEEMLFTETNSKTNLGLLS